MVVFFFFLPKIDSHAPSGKRVETWEDMRHLEFYSRLFDILKPTPDKLVPRVPYYVDVAVMLQH
jgi:hypothetical protein